jgi:uncharacterized protein (TIGR02118 family)
MQATVLLARRPPESGPAWLARSLLALARRFRDARVRMLVADVAPIAGARVPPPASFDVVVLVERARRGWPAPAKPEPERDDALDWLRGARAHRGAARMLATPPRLARAGERSPGVVFAATAVRAPGLDFGAFDAHWRDRHGPLALAHHAGLCGYEQIALEAAVSRGAPAIDGLALLHFPDAAAFRDRFYDSPAGRDAIHADTERFLDLPRCEAVLASEYPARP